MKKLVRMFVCIGIIATLAGCNDANNSLEEKLIEAEASQFSVGVLLPDIGLGDQSFNDLAVNGLVNARDDLNILWSYREATTNDIIEEQLQALIEEKHDLIIGVGYTSQEALEKLAVENPEQQFVIVDSASEVENIDGIMFKEDEGSYLAGVVAGRTSKTGVIGFVGGFEDPIILKFLEGFEQGAKSVNPDIQVLVEYANTYSDDKLGASIASNMIAEQADVLYAAAGYTGVGLLQEAQRKGVYAIGVDIDQYFYAEKAVITSMTKNIDVAVFDYVKNYIDKKPTSQLNLEFGIAEDGVDLAPIRIVEDAINLEQEVEKIKNDLK